MTIHKAKGLGFPVVVVLLYGESSHRFEYTVLREGDEERRARRPGRLVKLTQDLARRDPVLGALYDAETMKADVDRLNRLYVALTRAKREMYVIGVKGARDTYPLRPAARRVIPAVSRQGQARVHGGRARACGRALAPRASRAAVLQRRAPQP